MKLWSSFLKELTIASRGFYFYVEIFMAIILLFVLLFVVPENFKNIEEEYLYLEFPSEQVREVYLEKNFDEDVSSEETVVKLKKEEIPVTIYENDESRVYLFDSKEDMIRVAKEKHKLGVSVVMDDKYEMTTTFYTQGNETEKFINVLKVVGAGDLKAVEEAFDAQEVKTISTDYVELTDRENLLPVFLAFNGSLMGLFIMAAYVFLDKKEGVIKAFAVTSASVWKYLMSKMLMLTVTAFVTSIILIVPVMGTRINYLLVFLLLIPTGFFASALGLLLASYFDDMVKSFGVMYFLMIGMMLPAFSYYIPSWDPMWMKFVPSYYIIYGFKEVFTKGDTPYVLLIALGFTVVSALLFAWANMRYKRTLSV